MKDDLQISSGKLTMKDLTSENYTLIGYRGKNASKSKIIFCPYIQEQLSDEEYAKRFYANKTYALVKYEYPDDKYANQKGEVLNDKTNENGIKSYLLKINVSQKAKGHIHFVALKPKYEDVWFNESDIVRFLRYDENGKPIENEC